MNIGGGIFLVAVGAILAFAVDHPGGSLNISVVGWILMATGGVLIRLEVTGYAPRRRVIGVAPAIKEWRVHDDRRGQLLVRSPTTAAPRRSGPKREVGGQVRGTPRQHWTDGNRPPWQED